MICAPALQCCAHTQEEFGRQCGVSQNEANGTLVAGKAPMYDERVRHNLRAQQLEDLPTASGRQSGRLRWQWASPPTCCASIMCQVALIRHEFFTGNRHIQSPMLPGLSAYTVGQLFTVYEHSTAGQERK